MKLAEIIVDDYGGAPAATHNMPCAICHEKHAVYWLNDGYFGPCWGCHSKGWRTAKLPGWVCWLLSL